MTSNPSELAGAKNARVRWRNQGGTERAYADLRSIGGGQPALIPPGEKRATTDPEIAEQLLHQLLAKFKKRKEKKVRTAIYPGPDLADFAIHHLEEQAASDNYDTEWLAELETYLALAVDYFTRWQHALVRHPEPLPRRRGLASIDVPDVRAFSEWLKSMPDERGCHRPAASRRRILNALSNLFDRAIAEGKLPVGSNPVAVQFQELSASSRETGWLSVGELALLLESARIIGCEAQAAGDSHSLPCVYELIATFMLTGAREGEIARLQVRHLDFGSRTIHIPDSKTGRVARSIPMHSQLREILSPYVQRLDRTSGYVFTMTSGEAIYSSLDMLDLIATRAGFREGQIRPPVFRTSYIIHRLACMDQGVPIDPKKVAREVGYTTPAARKKVFARVQYGRARMDELAFPSDAIGPDLSARLQALYSPPACTANET
jgi:integrase